MDEGENCNGSPYYIQTILYSTTKEEVSSSAAAIIAQMYNQPKLISAIWQLLTKCLSHTH